MTHLIEVQDLRVSFRLGKNELQEAVRGVSFAIAENTTVALVGESGSGKSVSAMSIVRLLPDNAVVPPQSRILYQGRDLLRETPQAMRALRGKDISVVFQEPMSSLNPVFPVGEQIAEVLRIHMGMSMRQARERALELLQEVGIPEPRARLDAYPHELSGGQQQRVMIAIAIACEPKLLIADEPTTALDVTVQRQIVDMLARLQQRHRMSMLFISHDLGLVGEIASEVVVMRGGVIREQGSAAQIFNDPKDSYTQALLACRPRLDARPRRLTVIDDIMNQRAAATEEREPTVAEGAPLIEVTGLGKAYRLKTGLFERKVLQAVRGADFSLHKGRTLGIVGESGSGKTTVGMMLTRLTDASTGRILFDGTDLTALGPKQMRDWRRRIQIIFQNPNASLNPRFTVGQILLEPMRIHGIGANDAQRTQLALGWLEKVGLPPQSFGKYPHEFSGGQRQRIAIARCLTMRPEVVICDESVSALDVSVQATVLNLLLDLQEEFGLTYVFISHDLAVVKYMADDILVMNRGEIVERGNAQQIYAHPEHPYTRQLLAAIPRGWGARARAAEENTA
ncbi:MAG TPA: dipeptide ABC transporter ATP-binding protein [Ramlibacter sp.]|uniref:ABC transporter ATP-binding protein n=1 Tax=Ramlibacter sp. TaxID=1917967 RepID=UPI002D06EC15|nr:dipeptide ABC transporter ATP-binding protein [Ramlibacter sp.]HVZ46042.1 dipeptide ABC transporter ATP-binding protein [Ramlibacter sp.]